MLSGVVCYFLRFDAYIRSAPPDDACPVGSCKRKPYQASTTAPTAPIIKVDSMSLDRSDVEKIAHLARLAVSEEEKDSYAESLSSILSLVEQMNAVDAEGVTPMAHPLHMVQRLRADEPSEPDQRELFQQIAPSTADGLYLVPKVIE